MGRTVFPCGALCRLCCAFLITNNTSTRKVAYEIGQASLYTGAITLILKTAFGRTRPYMNEGTSSYYPFSSLLDRYHSFPGGHTATALVLSTILSRNAGPTWLKILAYLPAVFTPVSRYIRINTGCLIMFSVARSATLSLHGL